MGSVVKDTIMSSRDAKTRSRRNLRVRPTPHLDMIGKGKQKAAAAGKEDTHTFEMVVLGSGGGPLETDLSGYLLKPYASKWEDGIIALEGGSGLGALTDLFKREDADNLFPGVEFPQTHQTPVLKAAHIFSHLSCYLLSHAHLDHCTSMVLSAGSLPRRPYYSHGAGPSNLSPGLPVYGFRASLETLSTAFRGGLWPELAAFEDDHSSKPSSSTLESVGDVGDHLHNGHKAKRKRNDDRRSGDQPTSSPTNQPVSGDDIALRLIPLPLHSPQTLPNPHVSVRPFELSHHCNSRGPYGSTAFFIKFDASQLSLADGRVDADVNGAPRFASGGSRAGGGKELLFFGDMESSFHKIGGEAFGADGPARAKKLNDLVWTEAARVWDEGLLLGIFIECSYDSDRPPSLMFGHLSPPGLYRELRSLASKVKRRSKRDEPGLSGLKVYITHIKESLVPHRSGKSARDVIMSELRNLEDHGKLGVEFVEVRKGQRILL